MSVVVDYAKAGSESLFTKAVLSIEEFNPGPDTADNTVPVLNAITQAMQSGMTLDLGARTLLCSQQVAMHRVRVRGQNATLKFTGLDSSTDCLVLQGSAEEQPLQIAGVHVDANNCGRYPVVMTGGKVGSTSCDFMRITGMRVSNAVFDSYHVEPGGANQWIENVIMDGCKSINPGRHHISVTIPNLTNCFANKFSWRDFEGRGAGQTTAAYDVSVDLQGGASGQKASEWVFTNPELDAAGAANHQQASIRIARSGSAGTCHSWTVVGGTFEDTGAVITGSPNVVSLGASGLAEGLALFGGVLAQYGNFADATLFTNLLAYQSSSGRNIVKTDGQLRGTSVVLANSAVSDPSTLDWYEEGTWTPSITFGGGATGITYGTQDGTFTRVGNRVFFTCVVILTSKGSSAGTMLINGLPYASSQSNSVAFAVFAQNLAATINTTQAILSGSQSLSVRRISGGGAAALADTDATNTSDFRISGHYKV